MLMKSKSTQSKIHLQSYDGKKMLVLDWMSKYNPFNLRGAKIWTLTLVLGLLQLSTFQTFAQIAQRGTATTATTTGTSLTIARPTGVVTGDVMIVNIAQTGNNSTDPTSTGWTLIDGVSLAGGTLRLGAVLYKVATGTEGANYTFTLGTGTTSAVGSIVAFSGVNGTTPFDVANGTISVQGTQTAVAATTKTTVTANTAIIMCGMAAGSAPTWTGWTTTSPGTLTELYDNQSTTASVGAAWAIKPVAGATGAGAAILSAAERNGGILIALRPAAVITTYTSTGGGGNWNTAATWSPAAVPTAGSNVIIAVGSPVASDVNSAVLGNLTINGTLDIHTFTVSGTGTITVAGSGTLTIGGATNFPSGFSTTTLSSGSTVNYDNTGAQTVAAQSYSNLIISGSGTKTLAAATSVSGTITLTSGILATSAANLLSVTNTSSTAISGGSATSFINGPVSWTLPASLVSGSTYNFPVGKGTTYLPFSLVNPTTGTGSVTAQAEAFTGSTGGTFNATLSSISTTEYWSLSTAGNFTNSSVSVTRQTAITPLDAIGGSVTLAGQYVSLNGTAATNGVTGSNAIGTNRFFVLAHNISATPTYTSTGSGGNWNSTATWSPATVPTAGSNVIIAVGSPVTVNVNTAVIGNLTINSSLDAGTFTVSGTGTLTVAGTGTLVIGGATNFPSGFSSTTLSTGSTVNYDNAGAQTVSALTYSNLTISGSGTKTLAGATTVTGTFTLSSGILATTGANLLSVTNTATTAISGGSAGSFINGPVKWTLPASLGTGSTYNFPVGKGTTYLPFSLVNPTTGAGVVTAQAEAFTASTGGTFDATLTSISTTEYWSLVTSGNFTNSSISITRQTAITPLDAIGGSATLAGQYVTLAGTTGTNGVSNSNAIGSNRFFVFAHKTALSYVSVSPGGNWNSAATWNPASVPTAGSSVDISAVGPVTVTATPATLSDLSIDGLLDADTYQISGTGPFYISSTGTLLVGGTNNFPAGFTTQNLNAASYVNYNNAGNQTVASVTYGNLILSNSGVKTLPASELNVSGNFTLTGSATVTLTNLLTVNGYTTLAASSVLTLGANNLLSNSSPILLDGGTFRTGATTGFSETVDVLTVSNSSIIALGTGAHTLTFAASDGVSWSGASLTVSGWTGTPGSSGTAGRIFFGSSAGTLTPAELAKISFTGFPGTNATLLSTGELIPTSYPVLAITGVTDNGSACVGIDAAPVTYTITNTGGPAAGVTVTSNSTQFVVSAAPTVISGGGTATYVVTFTPNSGGLQNAIITVASTTPGSNSPTSSITGTGNEFPVAGLSSSAVDNTICAGTSVTFTATGGTSYEFFINDVSQGAASATATFTRANLTNGQIVTVRVTNATGCTATSTGIATTVNAIPDVPVIEGSSTVTVGSIALLGSPTGGGTWTSSDPTKATIDPSSGLITGVAEGTTTIMYTVANPNGCTNFATLLVTVSTATGIDDLLVKGDLSLKNHPNPFSGNTTISYILPSDGNVKLIIRNLAGQVIKTFVNEIETQGDYTLNIDLSDLQSGIYLATLSLRRDGKEVIKTIRLVKGN
jgi:hypothetical protein